MTAQIIKNLKFFSSRNAETGNSHTWEPITVLIVEDNPADIRLTQQAFAQQKIVSDLHAVLNGAEALKFLHQEGEYNYAPRPDIILLDLNLPLKNGYEVLDEVKNDPDLKSIPVVVLSTSSQKEDIADCYERYANCYITKPFDFKDFLGIVRQIESFWLNTVALP